MITDYVAFRDKLLKSVGCRTTTGHGDSCVPGWLCGGCSRVLEAANALTPLIELLEASRDEAKRSSLTSLPLKLKFAEENGLKVAFNGPATVNTVEHWMSTTRKRFEAAVNALTPNP